MGNDSSLLLITLFASVAIPNCILTVLLLFISVEKITLALAILAPWSSILLSLAPISAIREALAQQTVANLPVAFFRIQLGCNLLALAYGLSVRNLAIIVPNIFGLFCQIVWLGYALTIESWEKKKSVNWAYFLLEFIIACNVGFVAMTLLSINALSLILVLSQCLLYLSPLFILPIILRTRQRGSLNIPISTMLAINNGLWIAYGGLLRDLVVVIPSLSGYLLSIFQLLLIFWCDGKLAFNLGHLARWMPRKQVKVASFDRRNSEVEMSTVGQTHII